MRPEAYLRPLVARWWVIVLAALVAGLVGYALQLGKAPTYEASTRLVVTAQPPEYFADQLAANFTQALEPFVHNPNTVQTAVDRGYIGAGDAPFAYNVVTRSSRDNRTVAVALTDTDPARAARIVGALAHVVVDKNVADRAAQADEDRRNSTGAANGMQNSIRTPVLVVGSLDCAATSAGLTSAGVLPDCPGSPAQPNGPRTKLTAAAGALLGAVLGAAVVLAAGALDDSFKGSDDVRRSLALPVVGTIPRSPVEAQRRDGNGRRMHHGGNGRGN